MLKSMTGYGSAKSILEYGCIIVEVKSVNHRYLDFTSRVPKRFLSYESEIRKIIGKRFCRGRFDVTIQSDYTKQGEQKAELNIELAKEYYSALTELRDTLQLDDEINLSLLVRIKDLIVVKEIESEHKEEEDALKDALNGAFDSLERMRIFEGEIIYKDLLEKLGAIKELVDKIRIKSPQVLIYYRDRLAKRVKELSDVFELDTQRLDQEVIFFAEKSDITEELVRIGSHLEQFGMIMEMDEPAGRKLDFLLQEINREANTIGSKANDSEISQNVVKIKSELEKIREQIQNIE
ncbi:MAG: YicC/YloC family endoribonuclease [Thermodesulfobacteriota bacterium]|nr:YicC/YloC family endoribonuclease [Thermodesulfobacteriota bacterium]